MTERMIENRIKKLSAPPNKEETLFVNRKVPKKDIDGFLEVIMFPDYAVNDDEEPTGQFLDYTYHKYGFHAYRALLDAHTWQMEQKEKAKAIIPLIENEIESETPIVRYDENLFKVYCAGRDRKGKTPKNISGFSSVYLFYLGYLMGAGKMKGGVM